METIKAKLLNLIEKYIDLCQDDYKKKPLNFILEQLKLLFITKKTTSLFSRNVGHVLHNACNQF